MSKNDETILQLKGKIAEKKAKLIKSKFIPVTNLIINFRGTTYNLNVLNKENILYLMVELNALRLSEVDLKLDNVTTISGYKLLEWLNDLTKKLEIVIYKEQEDELKTMEAKLDKLLSDEKKTELELNDIANFLN